MSNPLNPYGSAADAYSNTASSTDPRALEGQVLLMAAAKLERLSQRLGSGEKVPLEDISEAVDFNRKLWTVFAADAVNPGHPLPQEIKNNIASLAVFTFKRSIEVLIEPKPEKIQVLIEIDRNIAAGLLKRPAAPAAPATKPAEKPASGQSSSGGNKSTDSVI